jgi:hypothetical protein
MGNGPHVYDTMPDKLTSCDTSPFQLLAPAFSLSSLCYIPFSYRETSVSVRFDFFLGDAFLLTLSTALLEGVIGFSNRNSNPDTVIEL